MADDAEEPAERLRAADADLTAAREDEEPVRVARALIRRARCLRSLDRRADGLADLAEVIALWSDDGDLRLREQVASATWLRLVWRRGKVGDAETLQSARELFSLARDQPSSDLDAIAARALGAQADAQRRLGDLRGAIATRRWLIDEYAEVRPRGRPDLVYDEWAALTWDLWKNGQTDECASTTTDLIAALEDSEVGAPQRRGAEVMRMKVIALWRLDRRAESLAVNDELQRRFAHAEEPAARRAAGSALVLVLTRYVYEEAVPPGIALAHELVARFDAETDADTLTSFGTELETAAWYLSETSGPFSVSALAMLASRIPRPRAVTAVTAVTSTRPRLRQIAWVLARLDCAMQITDAIRGRFADDDLVSERRAMALRARLQRAFILIRTGHWWAGAQLMLEFMELGAPAVFTALDGAQPASPGLYSRGVWMAAMAATTVDLGSGPGADRTRATIATILRTQRINPAADRLSARRVDAMLRDARRAEVSAGVPAGRARGWSSLRSRGRG